MGRESDTMKLWTAAQLRREKGAGGNSWPLAFFCTIWRNNSVLFSSLHTPVYSTWLLLVLPVAAPSISFAVNGRLMQSGSFCPPSFKDSIYYEFISLRGLGLGLDKEICNYGTHLNWNKDWTQIKTILDFLVSLQSFVQLLLALSWLSEDFSSSGLKPSWT